MLLGGVALSEEPISAQGQEIVLVAFQGFSEVPIETAPYYMIEPKALCWTVEGDYSLDWVLENKDTWNFNETSNSWIRDNNCN